MTSSPAFSEPGGEDPGKETTRGRSACAIASDAHLTISNDMLHGNHLPLVDAVLAAQEAYAETGALPELLSIHFLGDPGITPW